MKPCVETVLVVSLLAALASARPQSSSPPTSVTASEALAATEVTSSTTAATTSTTSSSTTPTTSTTHTTPTKPIKLTKPPKFPRPSLPPLPSPAPIWGAGGAVIQKNGLRLSAGSTYASGDIGENVVRAVGGGTLALHSSELDKPIKYQLGAAPAFTSQPNSNGDSSDFNFVYVKRPHVPGEKQNLIYVLVPHHVENGDLDRLNEVARSGVSDLTAKREVEKVEEEVTGILSYVPSAVRNALRNFFGLKKTFNFFNIFVNSNLHNSK